MDNGAGVDRARTRECQNACMVLPETRAGRGRRFIPWVSLAVLSLLTAGGLVLGLRATSGPVTADQLKGQLLGLQDLGPRWKLSGMTSSRETKDNWNDERCPSGTMTFGGPTATATYVSPNRRDTFTESLERPSVDPSKVIHAYRVCPVTAAHQSVHVKIARTALFNGIGSDAVGFIDTFRVRGHDGIIGGGLLEDGTELVVVGYVGDGPLSQLRSFASTAVSKATAG
jgi:hypothetical protein